MYKQITVATPMTKHQVKQMIRQRLLKLYNKQQQQAAAAGRTFAAAPLPPKPRPDQWQRPRKPQQRQQKQKLDVAWEVNEAPELILAPPEPCELMLPTPPVKPGGNTYRTAQVFVLQEGVYNEGEHDARRISGFGAPFSFAVKPNVVAAAAAAVAAPAPAAPQPAARVPHMAPPLPYISICTGPAERCSPRPAASPTAAAAPAAASPARSAPAPASPAAAAADARGSDDAGAEQAPRLKPVRKPALPAEARGKSVKPAVPPPPPPEPEDAMVPRVHKPALPVAARGQGTLAKGLHAEASESSMTAFDRHVGAGASPHASPRPALMGKQGGRVAAVVRDDAMALRHSAEGKLPRSAAAAAAGGGADIGRLCVSQSCHWPSSCTPPGVSTPTAAEASPASKKAGAGAGGRQAAETGSSPLTLTGGTAVSVGPQDMAILVVPAVALLDHKPLPYSRADWERRPMPEWDGPEGPRVHESYGQWRSYLSSWEPTVLVKADGSVVV